MRVLAVGLIGIGLVTVAAPGAQVPPDSATHWTDQVHRVTLDNGLTVLLLQRGTLPLISVEALYKVGSRNERPGLTGGAHFIEHMAFRRTERIAKADLTNQVLRWGGRWGGYTSYDQTAYNSHTPSEYLDWLLFMERQRLQYVLFDSESVDLERTSVISELHQYENDPAYTLVEHRLRRAALVAHPYGSPIMGWLSDLRTITGDDLQRFYREYYGANNLVLAIVGRFDEAEALALVRKHFADAPAGARSTRLQTVEPAQQGVRRVVEQGPGSSSHLELLVHAPAASDSRYPTLLVLDALLAGGKAEGRSRAIPGSRLHAALVASGLAREVTTEVELAEYPGLYSIGVDAESNASQARLEAALDEAVTRLDSPVAAAELTAAIEQVRWAFVRRDDSNRAIADRLARFEGVGSYALLPRITSGLAQVTAGAVRGLARDMLAPSRRTIGWFAPTPEDAAPTAGDAPDHTTPSRAVVWRHEGTVTPPPARLELPELPAVHNETLANGLRLGVVTLDGELVHLRVRVEAGAAFDPPGKGGMALVAARAVQSRVRVLDDALAARGVQLTSSSASFENPFDNRAFVEWTTTLQRRDVEAALSAVARLLAVPPGDNDIREARDSVSADLASVDDDSRWRADAAAWMAMNPAARIGQPLAHLVPGDSTTLAALSPANVATFFRSRYVPSQTIVALAGAIDRDAARSAVERALGAWRVPARENESSHDRPDAQPGKGRVVHVDLAHKAQASLTVALPGVGADSPDRPALSLLNYLLGETGYAGRLGEELVDTGIAYEVAASMWPHRGAGPIFITTDAVDWEEAVRRIRGVLSSFASGGLTEQSLDEARGFVIGRLLFRFETAASASAAAADLAALGTDGDLRTFGARVRAVTLAELNRAAARYYDPARAVFVVAGR